ncbi:heparinase II/III family protein [bacterium AH-315-F18]|nr:heparinase II/III family protein [bacterium AH-315-F18]
MFGSKGLVRGRVFDVLFLSAFVLVGSASAAPRTHPSLLVQARDFSRLQLRADTEPWKSMRGRALKVFQNTPVPGNDSDLFRLQQNVRVLTSTGALSYILYPNLRVSILEKLQRTLACWPRIHALRDSETNAWRYCVPTGSAFFNTVLALDIVHDEMPRENRRSVEMHLDVVAEWFLEHNNKWVLNKWGVVGIWAAYRGNKAGVRRAHKAYRERIYAYTSPDGVFNNGFGYAWARLSADEDAKTYFMDVLEFMKVGRFYDDPRLVKFYEWLYSGGLTPARRLPSFGDSTLYHKVVSWRGAPALYRAHRFSPLAAAYASWIVGSKAPEARLLPFVLMDRSLPTAVRPTGGIWEWGYASFWTAADQGEMMAALYSMKTPSVEAHAHKDTNAIHLFADGHNVLSNSGYAGWGQGASPYSWHDINNRAFTSNTITIAGIDHVTRHGGGLLEAFRSHGLDYATADSGGALPNGRHRRSLLMIAADGDIPGYVLVADEVVTRKPRQAIQAHWHPQGEFRSRSDDGHVFDVGGKTGSREGKLTVVLATLPFSVDLPKGALVARNKAYRAQVRYLRPTYRSDDKGKARFFTAFFPHAGETSTVALKRPHTEDAQVLIFVRDGGGRDIIIAPHSSSGSVTPWGRFVGSWFWVRLNGSGRVLSYFARSATRVEWPDASLGFVSTGPVTLHLKGRRGGLTVPRSVRIKWRGMDAPKKTQVVKAGRHGIDL